MYCKHYEAYKNLSGKYHLIVDTREQENERYKNRIAEFEELPIDEWERQKLDVGDYSAVLRTPDEGLIDFTELISIERKMSIEELVDCLGKDHERFENELLRAKLNNIKVYVAIESGSYNDLVNGNYNRKTSVNQVVSSYHYFEDQYPVHFVWVTPNTFVRFVNETLRRFIYNHLAINYPNGEILKKRVC